MAWEATSAARRTATALNRGGPKIEGPLKGHHHETYVITLAAPGAGTEAVRWKCREPRQGLLWFDRRCFASEEVVVEALNGRVERVPELIETKGVRLQRFVEGVTLGSRYRAGTAVPEPLVRQILEVVRQLAGIRPASVTVRCVCEPEDRATDGDSAGFLTRLIHFTEVHVFQKHQDEYGALFAALGVHEVAFKYLRERAADLHGRPFTLLHADLHRENLILDGAGQLWVIDWELAIFGDPLYDLATHLHLMRYPEPQRRRVTELWRDVLREEGARGLDEDLPMLLDYKRAQSVFTDVIRAALTLVEVADARARAARLPEAARKLRGVLLRGAAPLGIHSVPSARTIAAALDSWLRKDRSMQ
ncbi:phosphotransferase [Streptomyces kunmingensis]|uniref:Phosphotransferase n=1 Tax=Streptomyces kunmingensis TaxID=68225 RepID=A0ABU6C757_9ACTN|nr:phosphotransferase [Streptomyces kunmingensis]MEB3960066.1 phosphotransferase [Streptomyces kunmingensis]